MTQAHTLTDGTLGQPRAREQYKQRALKERNNIESKANKKSKVKLKTETEKN